MELTNIINEKLSLSDIEEIKKALKLLETEEYLLDSYWRSFFDKLQFRFLDKVDTTYEKSFESDEIICKYKVNKEIMDAYFLILEVVLFSLNLKLKSYEQELWTNNDENKKCKGNNSIWKKMFFLTWSSSLFSLFIYLLYDYKKKFFSKFSTWKKFLLCFIVTLLFSSLTSYTFFYFFMKK